MQGQRSTVESLPETFEFDHGSSSSNSGMDQQIYWNNMLPDPVETQNLPDYLLSPRETNMSFVNTANHDSASFNIWNSGGASSSEVSLNQGNHDESKLEHGWTSTLAIDARGGPRMEERRFEAANMLSLENVNINLNSEHFADGPSFLGTSIYDDIPQNIDHNAGHIGVSSQVPEAGIGPKPGLSESDRIPYSSGSSNHRGTSSEGVRFLSGDGDRRPGDSLDGRRSARKRKNIEVSPGPSSVSGIPSCFNQSENSFLHPVSAQHNYTTSTNISSSSDFLSGANPPEEQLNPRIGTIMRGAAFDCHPSLTVAGNAETSQRNLRMRIDPAHHHDSPPSNLWLPRNIIRSSNVWSPHQASSLLIPFNQSLESRPVAAGANSQSQPRVPIIPGLPQNVHPSTWNGASNSRIGSSSSSVISGDRSGASREEANSRNIPRSNISENSMFVPTTNSRHLTQDPTNWNSANGNISIHGIVAPTAQAGTSSGVHPSTGPTWAPLSNPPIQYPRSLSGVVRQSLFPSGGFESGGQSSNFPPQRPGRSSSSQEMVHHPGIGFRGYQQPFVRSASDRQSDGALGVPLPPRSLAAAREGRSRMISEIRNALDLMRRGENLRFEDVFILDQSMFYGGTDLHDRHRDMRLDVDNMSYEELLALEERIGNVSTGLSEETILKCLKQWKYLSVTIEASMEVEPCCICQEEYIEREELGTLDCGHDFHTACIKQWLMVKNLCPICKTTGIGTSK